MEISDVGILKKILLDWRYDQPIFKKILLDWRYDQPISIYSRFVGMTA